MKVAKILCLVVGIALTGITYAESPNLIIKNQTHAPIDENEYANVKIIVGNWMDGQAQVPQDSTKELTIPYKDIPVFVDIDVYLRNLPIAKKVQCSRAINVEKTTTITITANENPITPNSTITCQAIES